MKELSGKISRVAVKVSQCLSNGTAPRAALYLGVCMQACIAPDTPNRALLLSFQEPHFLKRQKAHTKLEHKTHRRKLEPPLGFHPSSSTSSLGRAIMLHDVVTQRPPVPAVAPRDHDRLGPLCCTAALDKCLGQRQWTEADRHAMIGAIEWDRNEMVWAREVAPAHSSSGERETAKSQGRFFRVWDTELSHDTLTKPTVNPASGTHCSPCHCISL